MGWTERDLPSQQGRTVLVTGANSGLGLNTSRALAAAGAQVLMACRTEAKARAAMREIERQVPQADLSFIPLDLSDLASVERCAAAVADTTPQVDVLVNNAGIMAVPHGHTVDGFEMQIGTNHFGHFALTGRLLPLLQAADAPRVVTVSSMAHRWTPGLDFDDLDWQRRPYKRWQAYGDSKLANLYFTYALASRAGEKLTVAAAHPGYANTHLQFVAAEQKKNPLEKGVMWLGNMLFAQSAARGALPSLYAAGMPDVASGEFFGPDGFQQARGYPTRVRPRRLARNEELADRLWAVSTERTGVSFAL